MTFDPAELLDPDKMQNGPMTFFWGQDEYVEPRVGIDVDRPVPGRRSFRQWLRRVRPWTLDVRLMPTPDTDLNAWGQTVAKTMGVRWTGEAAPDHRAVWLPGLTWARNAGEALASSKYIFDALAGFELAEVQVRVAALAREDRHV